MLSYLANDIALIISAIVNIVGIVFIFIEIKDKKQVLLKKGILIVVAICVLVCVNWLAYTVGRLSATGGTQLADSPLPSPEAPTTNPDRTEEQSQDDSHTVSENTVSENTVTDTDKIPIGGTTPTGKSHVVTGDKSFIVDGNNNDITINNNAESSEPTPPPVTVQKIDISKTELELSVEDKYSLQATVLYSDGTTSNSADWISSNPSVAQVDSNGKITALSAGETIITAHASKNNVAKDATCSVIVINPPIMPTGYSIQLSTDHAIMGENFRVYVTPYEDDVYDIEIYGQAPSGKIYQFTLREDTKYTIDTEAGTWLIYASVTNSAGTYMAQKPQDYVQLEISSYEDAFNDMFNGMFNDMFNDINN